MLTFCKCYILCIVIHSEYCLECILSVIEFIRFKQRILRVMKGTGGLLAAHNEEEIESMERKVGKTLILPSKCPESAIVNEGHVFKKIARRLYMRYIRTGSEFEINLRYSDRRMYSRLMENETAWLKETVYDSNYKLFELFDSCITEMCTLLVAAFSRYKKSHEYQVLKRYIDK